MWKVFLLLHVFFFFFLRCQADVTDFCIADLQASKTPAGYPCKNPANATVNDFVISGFAASGNTSNGLNFAVTSASVFEFPVLNGLGIAIARFDFNVGGVGPLHTHPFASEILLVTKGSLISGFIALDNKAYFKELKEGDVMVYPKGLLHFQVNAGNTSAVAIASFNSENPGIQATSFALFTNDLPSFLIEKSTFLDKAQVQKLKSILGGSG